MLTSARKPCLTRRRPAGDNEASARRVAAAVGIEDVRAGLAPEHKLAAVRAVREAGAGSARGAGVIMVRPATLAGPWKPVARVSKLAGLGFGVWGHHPSHAARHTAAAGHTLSQHTITGMLC